MGFQLERNLVHPLHWRSTGLGAFTFISNGLLSCNMGNVLADDGVDGAVVVVFSPCLFVFSPRTSSIVYYTFLCCLVFAFLRLPFANVNLCRFCLAIRLFIPLK